MNYLMFLRLRRGLSQKDLAELMKINPVTMCRLERGWYAKPPADIEVRLKAIFGQEWTFDRLMRPVPDFASNSPDAA
jgi:transcriptional regulator with XRE-family HTH domain